MQAEPEPECHCAEFHCPPIASPWESWQYIRFPLQLPCTNVISPPWHCPAAPIPINSSLSVLLGSHTAITEDANTAPHTFCHLLPLLLPLEWFSTLLIGYVELVSSRTTTSHLSSQTFLPVDKNQVSFLDERLKKSLFTLKKNTQPLKIQLSRVFLLKESISLEKKASYLTNFFSLP